MKELNEKDRKDNEDKKMNTVFEGLAQAIERGEIPGALGVELHGRDGKKKLHLNK